MRKRASIIGISIFAAGLIAGTTLAFNSTPKTTPKSVNVHLTSAQSTPTPTASTTAKTTTVPVQTTPTTTTPTVSPKATKAPASNPSAQPTAALPSTQPTATSAVTIVAYKQIPIDNLGDIDCEYTYSDGTTYTWQWQTVNPKGSWTTNSMGQDGHYTATTVDSGFCDQNVIGKPKS